MCVSVESKRAKPSEAEQLHRKLRDRQVFRKELECPRCSMGAQHLIMLGPSMRSVLSPVCAS